MGETPEGFTLIPASDEPDTAVRHIPLPGRGLLHGASALRRGGLFGGYERKSAGPLAGWELPGLVAALAPAVVGAASAAAVAWLNGRSGRRVKVKVGDLEAEAGSPAELEKVLKMAQTLRQRPPEDGAEGQ